MNIERDRDLAFCTAMLPRVSRTFAVSIGALPHALREAVQTAYLLCRIADTVEDDPKLAGAPREALFQAFDELMRDDQRELEPFSELVAGCAPGANPSEVELCVGALRVVRCFRALTQQERAAIRPHVLEMSRGMREFARRADTDGRLRLLDLGDLERYCYFVAGTVGELLTHLFAGYLGAAYEPSPATIERAVHFGIGLQFVNILKDIAEDYARGHCYMPEALALEHGIGLSALFEPESRTAALALVRSLARRARHHLRAAEHYALSWPAEHAAEVRLFCAVPLTLALLTLDEIEAGQDVLIVSRAPKVSRWTVTRVVAEARWAASSDDALRQMFARYSAR